MENFKLLFFFVLSVLYSCSSDDINEPIVTNNDENLTIFFINDQHGEINNFSKIKHIVDQEKLKTNVLLVCSGDMFSGNPVVDNYAEKGFPMIDLMNQVGFDVSVLGNHEFDYGESILKDRMEQANFEWVCANVDMNNSGIPEPKEYTTITLNDLKITFLGLVETNGKQNATIPSTHPWRVKNLTFQRPENIVGQYADIKQQENSDLLIALTHLGHSRFGDQIGDYQLANQFPFFDLIIGGHSHEQIDTKVNSIPIFQAGANLNYLGKIKISVKDKKVLNTDFELINLSQYNEFDSEIKSKIDAYNSLPALNEVIGYSAQFHSSSLVGCFYTDALKGQMQVDLSFQNGGGIRSSLDEGDITKSEIYEIDPFNNGSIIYTMTVGEVEAFLQKSGSGFYYAGLTIFQNGNEIEIRNDAGDVLNENTTITIGINDYIPAVYDAYFPTNGINQPLTTAETIIKYLENTEGNVNYPNCNRYFRYE